MPKNYELKKLKAFLIITVPGGILTKVTDGKLHQLGDIKFNCSIG